MQAIPDAARLLDAARGRTGLEDAGDPAFLTALQTLVRSINAESAVTPDGAQAAAERFLRLLVNRLRFEADIAANPGHPRGTASAAAGHLWSAAHRLDEVAPAPRRGRRAFQSLLFWQGFNPAPVPGVPTDQPDPRIAEAVRFLEWRSRLNPAADAAHHMAALEPEEDTYLLEYTLHTYWPTTYFNVPGFLGPGSRGRTATTPSRTSAQLLQVPAVAVPSSEPEPWLLKSPPNLGFEPELARHLPGARFVVLHRDPVDVIPSVVAIVRELRRLYCTGPGDLRTIGDWALTSMPAPWTGTWAWRQTTPADSVLDSPTRRR